MKPNKITGYLGTYFSPSSTGVYRFLFDPVQGAVTMPELWYPAQNSKYLSLHGGLLAAPLTQPGKAGLCLLDTTNAAQYGACYAEKQAACYVMQDDALVYTANYHEGSILIYDRRSLAVVKRIETGEGSGCHQVLLHGRYLLAICLLRDELLIYDRTQGYRQVGSLAFAPGTGPRHGIFDRAHRRLYLVSELSNELFVFAARPGSNFSLLSAQGILPAQAAYPSPPQSAAIRLSPDEKFLYLSTRNADLISVYRLTETGAVPVQQTASGGRHPRDFILSPDGKFLLVVHREDGGLVVFSRNAETGKLEGITARVPAPQAVSIVLEPPCDPKESHGKRKDVE